jgi:hypothetical protein
MATVDMDNANTSGYVIYPAGTYKVRIKEWKRQTSKNKGTPQIEFKTEIINGQHNGSAYNEYIPITDRSVWKLANFIASCGIKAKGKFDTEAPVFTTMLDQLLGRSVFITLIHDETYNNNKPTGYAIDDEQDEIEFEIVDDTPDFAK